MSRSIRFLIMLVFLIGMTGSALAAQPAITQINYPDDCTLLYAIQPGETLPAIAQRFGTTSDRILEINGIEDEDSVFTGLVVCLATEEDELLPPTGAQGSLDIVDVDSGDDVTVSGDGFPAGINVNVLMGEADTEGAGGINVDSFTVPEDGSFVDTFNIPGALEDEDEIAIRFQSTTTDFFAFEVFRNTDEQAEGCQTLYTVERGDTLSIIAQRFGTTVNRLIQLNDIEDRDIIFPGQVLCVAGEGEVLPPTGGDQQVNPTISISSVTPGEEVTIRGSNFPGNTVFNVLMGEEGTQGVGGVQVASFTSPAAGDFLATFNIPSSLADDDRLVIRTQSTTGGFFAFATFDNTEDQDDDDDGDNGDDGDDEDEGVPGLDLPSEPVARNTADINFGERVTLSQGNAGFFTASSGFSGTMTVSRYDPTAARAPGLNFTQRLLRIQLEDASGNEISAVRGLNYVFFEITDTTRSLYDFEDLNIYQFDTEAEEWELCEIRVPVGEPADPNRLSCVVRDFGVFGIAVED